MKHTVVAADRLEPGERVVAEIAGREVAVFNRDGEYVAFLNWCPHQGGPCCEGQVTGTMEASHDPETGATDFEWGREGDILNCPWHGWEYDLDTGDCLSRPDVSLPSYPVTVDDGDVVVTL